jgi:hypothetical protein
MRDKRFAAQAKEDGMNTTYTHIGFSVSEEIAEEFYALSRDTGLSKVETFRQALKALRKYREKCAEVRARMGAADAAAMEELAHTTDWDPSTYEPKGE